jgi:CheY-like chemotaxis protein
MTTAPLLAAEDEESDAVILRMAYERTAIPNPLVMLRDGQEAVDYLMGIGGYSDRAAHPLPRLLLLDLKMPRMSGFDVLDWLAGRPEFKNIPVVILSSSPDLSDVRRAKQAGAEDYFVKPHQLRELVEILQTVQTRWLSDVRPEPS